MGQCTGWCVAANPALLMRVHGTVGPKEAWEGGQPPSVVMWEAGEARVLSADGQSLESEWTLRVCSRDTMFIPGQCLWDLAGSNTTYSILLGS